MKLETFFEKFDQFADAPDAVAKMRELILNLALQGRFLADDGNNSSSAEWKRVRLDSVANIAMGNSPPGESYNERGEGVPLINGPVEFSPGPFGLTIQTKFTSAPTKFCKRGDLLICVRGSTTGRTNIASFDACIGRGVAAISAGENQAFVNLFLWQRRSMIFALGTGSTFPSISYDDIASLQIALPPLAEQKRIVAKVDELMALCDRLALQQQERETRHAALARASLARFADAPTPANLPFLFHPSYAIPPADLRKSILTLAVQGKLVPQDPNDEPAEVTCPGLKALTGEESDVPNQWALCTYRALTTLVTSGSRGWKEFYAAKGSIFVRTQNIKTDKLILEDVAFVDLPKSAEGMRAQVLKDDILITITGANVTKAARVEEQIPEAYVSQHIALTRPRWPKMSEWLHLCFISHGSARGTLEQLAYGDKPGLNLNNIRDLVLPIPPLAEQRRIVAKVEQLMALVDALETQLAASRATAANLLSALVAELITAHPSANGAPQTSPGQRPGKTSEKPTKG